MYDDRACVCGTPRQASAGASLKRKSPDTSDEASRIRACGRTEKTNGDICWGPHNLTELELPAQMLPLPNQRGGAESYVMKSVNGPKIQAPPKSKNPE